MHFLLFWWQSNKGQPKRWHINVVHHMSHQDENINLSEQARVGRIQPDPEASTEACSLDSKRF